jgi:demethylmenaquinone methyltransferase/2-methoxy-6-polyprenyl-1,4-benzoquinol methylase
MTKLPQKEEKSEYVLNMFNRIAKQYDLMNDLMTGGLHRLWKQQVIKQLNIKDNEQVLDLCCGTGDLTVMMADHNSSIFVTGLDFSEQMLEFARTRKSKLGNVTFLQGDAMKLPFEDNCFDKITISFGLRNVTDYEACLREVFRVCKTSGKLVILDLSHPTGFWDKASQFYRFQLLPTLGKIIANDKNAYAYLPNSISNYPNQENLASLMQKASWQQVNYTNLFGGVIAIHEGYKAF